MTLATSLPLMQPLPMPVYITFASKRNDRGWEYSWLQPHRDDPESIYYDRTTPNELMDDLHHLYDTLHEILQRKHRDRKRQPKMQLPDQYEFHDVLFACGHVQRVPIGTYNSEMWFWREFFKRCVTPQMAEDMPASFTARLNAVYERTRTNSQRGAQKNHLPRVQETPRRSRSRDAMTPSPIYDSPPGRIAENPSTRR